MDLSEINAAAAYGEPDLGVTTTRWILGLALPGTVLSLLVAIRINKPA